MSHAHPVITIQLRHQLTQEVTIQWTDELNQRGLDHFHKVSFLYKLIQRRLQVQIRVQKDRCKEKVVHLVNKPTPLSNRKIHNISQLSPRNLETNTWIGHLNISDGSGHPRCNSYLWSSYMPFLRFHSLWKLFNRICWRDKLQYTKSTVWIQSVLDLVGLLLAKCFDGALQWWQHY